MTQTTNGLRPLTDVEREAVTLHLQKTPIDEVAERTGLSAAQIAAAVDQAGALTRYGAAQVSAQRSTPAAIVPSRPVPTAVRIPGQVTPVDPTRLTTSALLTWADEYGTSRARMLAARIRESAKELRTLREGDTARAEAAAEVERLTAELEAAKSRLKEAGGKPGTAAPKRAAGSAPDPGRKAQLAAVRAWAAATGREVSALGRIPKHIQDEYDTAHGGTK